MTGVVLTELLQGLKTDRERQRLTALFSSLPFIETVRADWQNLPEMLSSSDSEAAGRVMEAMLKMKKLDIAELEQAFAGELVKV